MINIDEFIDLLYENQLLEEFLGQEEYEIKMYY